MVIPSNCFILKVLVALDAVSLTARLSLEIVDCCVKRALLFVAVN